MNGGPERGAIETRSDDGTRRFLLAFNYSRFSSERLFTAAFRRLLQGKFGERRLYEQKKRENFTVSSRGACRTPWSRRRFSSAFCARLFCALRPRELASRRAVPHHHLHLRRLLLPFLPSRLPHGDGGSPRRHLADHLAPQARSPPLDGDAADLAFDSRRDRHCAINPPPPPSSSSSFFPALRGGGTEYARAQ